MLLGIMQRQRLTAEKVKMDLFWVFVMLSSCSICLNVNGEEDFDIEGLEDIFGDEVWEDDFNEDVHSRQKRQFGFSPVIVTKYSITSTIVARFSETEIINEVTNMDFDSQKSTFRTQIPAAAFISRFSIIVDGKEHFGIVREKKQAQQTFRAAVEQGIGAGLVEQIRERDALWFEVSISVKAQGVITYKLRYQELLIKSEGKYTKTILAFPPEGLPNFQVKVLITEPTGIGSLTASFPYKGKELNAPQDTSFNIEKRQSRTQALVTYDTSTYSGSGTSLRFVVSYDVRQPTEAGTIWTHNGYFAHFFAPKLPVLPKKIVFVIDVSGSMRGDKMTKVISAFNSIFEDLNQEDSFNIVTFNSKVHTWKESLVSAYSFVAKDDAKAHVKKLIASGGTNFAGGIFEAITLLDRHNKESGNVAGTSVIFILTDGKPTAGVSNLDDISKQVKAKNTNKYAIFCIGFGSDVDESFLTRISLENHAEAKMVEVAKDAEAVLGDFYGKFASPILTDLTSQYLGNVKQVTKTDVPVFYKGMEQVVMGQQSTNSNNAVTTVVTANGFGARSFSKKAESEKFDPSFTYPVSKDIQVNFDNFFERMWAQLRILQLLAQKNFEPSAEIDKQILETSLKYSLVTPLTSMIVVDPQGGMKFADLTKDPKLVQHAYKPPMPSGTPPPPTSRPFATTTMATRFSTARRRRAFVARRRSSPVRTTRPTTTKKTTTRPTRPPLTAPATTPFVPLAIPRHPKSFNLKLSSEKCGGSFVAGPLPIIVQSSGNVYHRNLLCKWDIILPPNSNKRLALSFTKFDLEYHRTCGRDRVIIYIDPDDSATPQYRPFCGFFMRPGLKIYAQRKLTIIFQTDESVQGGGFRVMTQMV